MEVAKTAVLETPWHPNVKKGAEDFWILGEFKKTKAASS
jgi:hypothetical protein